jgi:GLPGLI family protein
MKFLFLLAFLVSTTANQAQNNGIVYYGHIESPGKGGPVGLDFNAYLVFNKEASYYVTAKDSLEKQTELEEKKIKEVNGNQQVYLGKHTLPQGKQVYYNRAKDSLWWNKKYKEPVYGREKRANIDWNLGSETKTFGGLTCHKATGTFRGKNYTAWYTDAIPLPYGPWKLQGLPGLILEAYDEKKEMYLYFKSLEYPVKRNLSIGPIEKPEVDKEYPFISIEEYKQTLNELVERSKTKAILIAKQMGADITVKTGGVETLSVEVFD